MVFIPIGLRNQKWERIPLFWHATVGHSVAPEFIMPPRRTGFNEYMPQGQRTLTEVDGVREAGLEEPGASAANGGGIDMNVDVAEADIDNLNAGGFFARYGREPNGPSPTVIPPHTPGGEP